MTKHLIHYRLGLPLLAILFFLSSPSARADSPPTLGGCPVLPADNIWNAPVDTLPVDPNSAAYITTIGATSHVHADFGSGLWDGAPIGIPFVVVPSTQVSVTIHISPYASQSDPGPYPVPANAPVEGAPNLNGDRHTLVLRQGECKLYELYRAFRNPDNSWNAESAAKYDLNSNALRPDGWTSADAAGLPILPGLALYDEVAAGEITHALRFTVPQTRRAYVWPARHYASPLTGAQYPPMGQRFRLKAGFDISGFSRQAQVILLALKKYGLILADNGSAWFISGAPDERWDNDMLHELDRVFGSDFEAVDVSSLMVNPDSGQVQGFSFSAAPSFQAINPTESATYTLTVQQSGSFSSPVTVTIANPAPGQLNLTPASSTVTPTAQVTLIITDTLDMPALPGRFYTFPITASGGGFTYPSTVSLLVGGTRTYLPLILK